MNTDIDAAASFISKLREKSILSTCFVLLRTEFIVPVNYYRAAPRSYFSIPCPRIPAERLSRLMGCRSHSHLTFVTRAPAADRFALAWSKFRVSDVVASVMITKSTLRTENQ